MISLTPTPSLVHRIRSAVVFLFPIPNPTREAPKSSEERKLSSDLYSSVPKFFDKKKAPRCGVGTASYINLGSAGDGR
ncbi:hypothetical protein FF1_006365 [Malus domestica]